MVGADLLRLEADVPGGIACGGDDVEEGGEEGDGDHTAQQGVVVLDQGGEQGQACHVEEVVQELAHRQKPPPLGEVIQQSRSEENEHGG